MIDHDCVTMIPGRSGLGTCPRRRVPRPEWIKTPARRGDQSQQAKGREYHVRLHFVEGYNSGRKKDETLTLFLVPSPRLVSPSTRHRSQSSRIMTLELDTALVHANQDPEIRVIILRGEGKHFSSVG